MEIGRGFLGRSKNISASSVPHPFPEFNSQATQSPWGTPYRPLALLYLYTQHGSRAVEARRSRHRGETGGRAGGMTRIM